MTDLDTLSYTAEHEWIARDGDVATVGITDHAAEELGDIVFVDLPAVGSTVAAGSTCGEIESTKSVGELFAPVSGEVVAVNTSLDDDPSVINTDPFGAGWLVKIRGTDTVDLLDRAGYVALVGGAA